MLRLAERGDNTKVDMLVGDIYGSDYGKIGLKSSTIASSFGKVYRTKRRVEREAEDYGGMVDGDEVMYPPVSEAAVNGDPHHHANPPTTDQQVPSSTDDDQNQKEQNSSSKPASPPSKNHVSFRPEDISKSLLYAISNNIGQIAYLHAEKHACERIYFGGSFIGGHWQTMATLSYAIRFWSKGGKVAYFLRHEGYLGAVGAFLRQEDEAAVGGGGLGKRRASLDGLWRLKSR